MKRARLALLALMLASCTTPLEQGERLYRQGDRLGALETWREVPEDDGKYGEVRERIDVVEAEFQNLVVRYKKRGSYFESKGHLAESILNYRLALKLQPDDAETLAQVQQLARSLAAQKAELRADYQRAFQAGDLATAGRGLDALRSLDPLDPELVTAERQIDDALRAEIDRRIAMGRRGFASGNYDAAKRYFRGVLELDPDDESARGYLSYIATIRRESGRSGERPAAFTAPESFATDAQIRAEGFYQNALAAERKGDLYAAIRHDLRALRADGDHSGARNHLASVRRRLAGNVDPLIEAGRTAFRNEDLQSALELWRKALLVDPGNERIQAYVRRAERQIENLERFMSEPQVSGQGG